MTRLPPLDPAVAETRVAVRRVLASVLADGSASASAGDSASGSAMVPAVDFAVSSEVASTGVDRTTGATTPPLVLVGLSGGADSLALAAALAFEAPRLGVRAGALIINHGLQQGSADVAERAAAQARDLGLDPVVVRTVAVERGSADGPEAAARNARYAALETVRTDLRAAALLTAHTRDDQAEQVLLALARGSGTRAVSGIPPTRGAIHRPFLSVTRETTLRACEAQGLEPWHDPHNRDPAYARVRVRTRVLPVLEHELGPGVAANLARSAELAREDADALDDLAREAQRALVTRGGAPVDRVLVPVEALGMQPSALRNRIIRGIARDEFGSHLTRDHTLAVAALVTAWRGQGPIHVPGATVERVAGSLVFRATG